MGRQIITQKDLAETKSVATRGTETGTEVLTEKKDTFTDRLLKYIPAEVVAVYVFVEGIIRQSATPEQQNTIFWTVFIILWVCTPLYLWRVQHVTKVIQLIVSFLAFFVWVFALGGPFVSFGWYNPIYGAVLLPLYTFLIPIIEPQK
jgi:hypothetical protein